MLIKNYNNIQIYSDVEFRRRRIRHTFEKDKEWDLKKYIRNEKLNKLLVVK